MIARHIEKPIVGGLFSFHEFDIFKGVSTKELSVVEGMLEMGEYLPDTKIIAEGDEPDEMFLLAEGSVSVYHQDMKGGERGGRTYSFGVRRYRGCGWQQALRRRLGGRKIACYTLSRDRLAELFESHPQVYASILRNLLIFNFGRLRRRNLEISALKT